MNTRVKRLVLPLGGAVAASALLGASLVTASAATAAPLKSSEYLAKTPSEAYSVAQFWLDSNSAALKGAKEFKYDYKLHGEKLQIKGGPAPDSKPGVTSPTGFGKVKTTKVRNVNLPKTVGKVFWVDGKGQTWWASGSAIHSRYGNLVATAAHNVFDGKGVFDKWVFVPGYYKGRAPWGVYVGKQAWTHYDFTVYEDWDKDYAFVNVYNGFSIADKVETNKPDFDAWTGDKFVESKEISEKEFEGILDKYGPKAPVWSKPDFSVDKVGPSYPGKKILGWTEVTEGQWSAAPSPSGNWKSWANGTKAWPRTIHLTEAEYEKLLDEKAAGKVLGKLEKDGKGNFKLTKYYLHQWYKFSKSTKYYLDYFYIGKVKDVGTLSKNVGGQGFAWNQKRGTTVFAFGYPAAEHPDGNKPYTGVTQKWSYGKTYTAVSAKKKAEESIGLKSSLTGGADGGPFIWQYSSAKRVGYINGVISWFGDSDDNGRIDFIASPYFDGETKAIYDAAANAWSGTIVGKNGEILK